MITDTEIRLKGLNTLVQNLGEVIAERFIALILKEKFDYTKWQNNLFPDINIDTLSQQAMLHQDKINDLLTDE